MNILNIEHIHKIFGDKVIFGKYAGQTVKVDGDEVMVMREEDIMGIVS